MNRLLSIVALLAVVLISCESVSNTAPKITITSQNNMYVSRGSAMGIINYIIENPVDDYSVNATADVEWIHSFSYKTPGRINFSINSNPDSVERIGVITLTYGDSSATVTIRQAENPAPMSVDVEANFLDIKYFGIQGGLHNYYLSFSDFGMDGNNGYKRPNATYYFVDLYLLNAGSAADGYKLPLGRYEYDNTNSEAIVDSFKYSFSWYQMNDNNGSALPGRLVHYDSGRLIVEEDKITLCVGLDVDSVSQIHTVVFNGDYNMIVELQ